jgi:hypothetical protein
MFICPIMEGIWRFGQIKTNTPTDENTFRIQLNSKTRKTCGWRRKIQLVHPEIWDLQTNFCCNLPLILGGRLFWLGGV